jgi:hypothetical protein
VREEELDEMQEALQTIIGQFGPMMKGFFEVILTIFEDEELVNRMVWAEAARSGKLMKALQENGFSRDEALSIVSNQGSIISSLGSMQSK